MIEKIINDAIAQDRNVERVRSGKFSVGGAGRCRLARTWDRMGKEGKVEPDERVYRIFEIGHIFEKWILDRLGDRLVSTQGLVEDEHRKGFYDAIVRDEEKRILYDVKTVHSRKFHNNTREGWDKDTHYHAQLITYWDMLPASEKPDECRLCYVSKDDLCIQEVVVDIYSNIDKVRLDWAILIGSWLTGAEPDANPMSWECGYCTYNAICDKKIVKEEKPKRKKKGENDGFQGTT